MSKKDKSASGSGKPKNLHANHRSRMLRQYLSGGGEQMHPHQLLELLLFYSIPRRDTNPTAHQLLDEFGSVPGILEQTEEALCGVPGVGPASARLICCVGAIRSCLYESAEQTMNSISVEQIMKQLDQALPEPPASALLLLLVDGRGNIYPPAVIREGQDYSAELRPLIGRIMDAILERCRIERVCVPLLVEYGCSGMPDVDQALFARTVQMELLHCGVSIWDYISHTPERNYSFMRLSLLQPR